MLQKMFRSVKDNQNIINSKYHHLVSVPVSPGEAEGAGPQLREHLAQLAHQVLVAGAHRLVHHKPPHLGNYCEFY